MVVVLPADAVKLTTRQLREHQPDIPSLMFLVFVVSVFFSAASAAPEAMTQEDIIQSQYQLKRLVILQSTKEFEAASKTARLAAEKLGVPLQLGDLAPHAKLGLTHNKSECEGNGFNWPCYMPRGRYDDGAYISIEHSTAFKAFAEATTLSLRPVQQRVTP